MSFKKTFEKNLNKELEADLDREEQAPPPPPIDMSYQPHICPPPAPLPQPPQVFESYPARRGMYIPTPIFILFLLVFIFESTVLFVYTIVALYNTLPMAIVPRPMAMCPEPIQQHPINFAPNFVIPSADNHQFQPMMTTQLSTVTVTATPSPESTTTTTATTSSSTSSASTTSKPKEPVTVTKPAPTITVISTASSPELPQITTETILSTQSLGKSTVTSVAVVTAA